MPTKVYFPRQHRHIDSADRGTPRPSGSAAPVRGPKSGGAASGRRSPSRKSAESVASHDRPADAGPRPRPARPPASAAERAPQPGQPKEWLGEWSSSRASAESSPEWSPEPSSRSPKRSPAERAPRSPQPAAPRSVKPAAARASARSGEPAPARVAGHAPKPVAIGEWLWACRAGSEPDLCDELLSHGLTGRVVQPALVASAARPRNQHKEDVELAFARQGLPVQALCTTDAQELATLIGQFTADRRFTPEGSGLALHVFSPDSDEGNLRAAAVLTLQARLTETLTEAGIALLADGKTAHGEGGRLIQVCLLDEEHAALGVLPARAAPSLFPGGRQRYKKPKDAPARSALKLVEALAWLGHGPQSGEVCVDLGAAPGGWSQVLLERRCHVVAIDPGRLAPHLTGRLEHLRMNAFSFEPEIPADWVLCDMAYRPLEVAGLLAKWGRHRWAQFLLANIKLPMNRRVDMLARVREILATGGWTGLRMRQLYHDRDEITLSAWRGFGIDTRVPQHRAPPGAAPVGLELERRDNAEVRARAADGPVQVGVLRGAGGGDGSVGQHDLR